MHFKGLIMEINIDNIIVMKADGTMVKLINKDGAIIGDTIYFVEEDVITNKVVKKIYGKKSWFIPLATVAMLAIMFITPSISGGIGSESYAMVSLDINPSTSFVLDENQNIIEVNNINSDSENLKLDELVGMNLDEGLKVINNKLLENGYLKNNGEVLASLSFYNKLDDSKYEEEVKNSIVKGFSEANITYIKSNEDNIKAAKKKGI
ncbi:MAG: anti-sigma-I factor RsgI family protein, partial [Clostridium sp.]